MLMGSIGGWGILLEERQEDEGRRREWCRRKGWTRIRLISGKIGFVYDLRCKMRRPRWLDRSLYRSIDLQELQNSYGVLHITAENRIAPKKKVHMSKNEWC